MNSTTSGILQSLFAMLVCTGAGGVAFGQGETFSETTASAAVTRLNPGDHVRTLMQGKLKRTAIVHVPPKYNPDKPTPIVLAIHGAAMNASMMVSFCGMNGTADEKGFIVVYPNGSGPEALLTWNAGGFTKGVGTKADDVKFLNALIDDVAMVVNVDPKRIYASGMSNGGMMCYRLAAESSNRIAAIAPVAGTMGVSDVHPHRPISVIHFHGTQDTLVPFEVDQGKSPFWLRLKSVNATIQTWIDLDGIDQKSKVTEVLSKAGDELKVTRKTYGPGRDGTEVVLVTVEGGGHSWPGQPQPFVFLGKTTLKLSANALIWEFFEKHPLK